MKLLLDTHVVLWELGGATRRGPQATEALAQASEIHVSAISFAEIGIKSALGKLSVPPDLIPTIHSLGVRTLAFEARHGLALHDLPGHHRDPFDRMLIVQAQDVGLTIVTADGAFSPYDVPVIDLRS